MAHTFFHFLWKKQYTPFQIVNYYNFILKPLLNKFIHNWGFDSKEEKL